MNINAFTKKIVSFGIAALLSVSCGFSGDTVRADTMSDLEAKQAKLEQDCKDVEEMLSKYETDAEETEKYLEEYDNKMKLQEEQVAVVEEQIALYEEEVAELEADIESKEADVEESVEKFKQRLRTLYMSGSSTAEVITGSSSFYDILSRLEFTERISRHDNQLIDSINEKINELEESKSEYGKILETLNLKKSEGEKYYSELRETYNNHAETKKMQEKRAAEFRERSDEIIAERQKVEEELQAEIRRLQKEAEEKRQAEAEARRLIEEQREKEAAANNTEYVPEPDPTPASYSETGFIWPVPTVRNVPDSDGFGKRWFEEENRWDNHKGIDITKPGCGGEAVVASAGGTVIQAGDRNDGYGECVVIDHGDGLCTRYAHNRSVVVSVGDTVTQGQVISYIGHT
ncbi:MAG: peptidoglycan DD-metalloendopeptidase family protein, partial [Oscillospiraceae bacterium]|nr:peptidoglycan DD-metalloendopeptidase family protein [Oscillospiraceae bacterium]